MYDIVTVYDINYSLWYIYTVKSKIYDIDYLVGGFKHFLHNIWDNPSHCLSYFSRWVKTTNQLENRNC